MPLSLATRAPSAPAAPRAPLAAIGLTPSGGALFVLGIMVAGSAFLALRIEVGGLLVHPFVPLVGILALWLVPWRIRSIPFSVVALSVLAVGFFFVASLAAPGGNSEVIKLGTSIATMLTVACAVRSREDFDAGALGLALGVGIIAARGVTGLADASPAGLNPMEEIGNKNAFSLFGAPALVLALHGIFDSARGLRVRAILAATVLLNVVTTFATANRSGYLGVVVAGMMFLVRSGQRRNALVAIVLATLFGYVVLTYFDQGEVVERRVNQTVEGTESDSLRRDLMLASIDVGLDHPLLGVSPQRLPFELARHVPTGYDRIDPHNTWGLLFGGGGTLTLACFLLLGYALWRLGARASEASVERGHMDGGSLLRIVLVLWLLRSMFTREILYSPSFSIALGLCVGLAIVEGRPQPEESP